MVVSSAEEKRVMKLVLILTLTFTALLLVLFCASIFQDTEGPLDMKRDSF